MSYSETLVEDAADKLEKTVRELRTFLVDELNYVVEIQESLSELDIHWKRVLTDDYENEVDDNIDYLVRDLVPEYKKQLGGIDTLVDQLKEVQAFRKEYLKEAQNDNQN